MAEMTTLLPPASQPPPSATATPTAPPPPPVLLLDKQAVYKIGMTPVFLAEVIAMGVETAVFVLTLLESNKIRILTVQHWQYAIAAELAVGVALIVMTLVWGKYFPNTAGEKDVIVYDKRHWHAYLVFAAAFTMFALFNLTKVILQYTTYANRLDLADFDPAKCSVTGAGATGCQFDAAEALGQWFTLNTIHGLFTLVQVLCIVPVVQSEWNPMFTDAYKERQAQLRQASIATQAARRARRMERGSGGGGGGRNRRYETESDSEDDSS